MTTETLWPVCDECGEPSTAVYASPLWGPDGYIGTEEERRAYFYCEKHGENNFWYWMYLRPCSPEEGISILNLDDIRHVIDKNWGLPFILWLLGRSAIYPSMVGNER